MLFYLILFTLILLLLLCLFGLDTFISLENMKYLNIKYNAKNVTIPLQLTKPDDNKEKLNSRLDSQPLRFPKQLYNIGFNYPYVGELQSCDIDADCSQITAKCHKPFIINNDDKKRNTDIGVCTLRVPDKTVFDISF